ncbi:hypothetical protein [Microcoleus vaginatus]|uniref:hypothetical protein n=1 Tax=Microcoleus vaginatus TaxID=119532 RepID=UPI001688AB83|nr:hypothetical protein [Microcoleus sp. FACHB-84]
MPSKEIDKEQEKAIDQRPNYFAGQYLLEDDFQLEQKYHIDRQRRHNRLLHVSGIAEGLKVSKDKDLAVNVSAGTAIDSQGRQIILPGDQPVDLGKIANTNELKDSEYTLSIRYKEELIEKQDSEENTHRRVQEKPAFELSTSTTPDVIPIAKLIIKGGKVESIDSTERVYSGICLPTENGKEVTLRSSHGDDKPNLAVLTGSLSISGALEVKGGSTLTGNVKANGSLTVSNKGEGLIAEFTQQGEGGGVNIGGVKGENNALYINNNKTENATVYVENEGKGTTLEVRQKGTGKAAEFKGKVRVDGDAELTGSLSISKALAVTGEITLTGNTNIRGKLQVEGGIKSPALQSIYKTAPIWRNETKDPAWQTIVHHTFTQVNQPMEVYVTVIANGHGRCINDGTALDVAIFIYNYDYNIDTGMSYLKNNNNVSNLLSAPDGKDYYYGMGITHLKEHVPIIATRSELVNLNNFLKIEVKMRTREKEKMVDLTAVGMLILLTGAN